MNKEIERFRSEEYGYFVDLSGSGHIAVDPGTGNVLLDEGFGPDRYHGAIIPPEDFRAFTVERTNGNFHLILQFRGQKHDIGSTVEPSVALAWAQRANASIAALRKTRWMSGQKLVRPTASDERRLPEVISARPLTPLRAAPRMTSSVNVFSDAVYLTHPPPSYGTFQKRREFQELGRWVENRDHSVCVIAGAGGSGKSTLAIQFLLSACPGSIAGYGHGRASFDTGFYYSFAADPSPSHFLSALAQWASPPHKGIPRDPRSLFDLLRTIKNALIVLDGIETLNRDVQCALFVGYSFHDFVASFHEKIVNGPRLLVSTRESASLSSATRPQAIDIGPLPKASAVALLQSRGVQGDEESLQQFAAHLQYHPLCLELAANQIREFGWSDAWAGAIQRNAQQHSSRDVKTEASVYWLSVEFMSSLERVAPEAANAFFRWSIAPSAAASPEMSGLQAKADSTPTDSERLFHWTLDLLYRSAVITKYAEHKGRVSAAVGGNAEYFFEPESLRPARLRWKTFLPVQQIRKAITGVVEKTPE